MGTINLRIRRIIVQKLTRPVKRVVQIAASGVEILVLTGLVTVLTTKPVAAVTMPNAPEGLNVASQPVSTQARGNQAASNQNGALPGLAGDAQQTGAHGAVGHESAMTTVSVRRQGVESLALVPRAAATTPATGISQLGALSESGQAALQGGQPSVYPLLYLGQYQTVEADWFKDPVVKAARVSSENQLPVNFRPGLLLYDASGDFTSWIGEAGLTTSQKAVLNARSNQWMNSLRSYYYKDLRGNLMEDGLRPVRGQDGTVQPAILKTDEDFWNVTQNLARLREQEDWTYDHTTKEYGSVNYYDVIRQAMGQAAGVWCAENLYTLAGRTMLEFEVNLYNRMQAMLYNELVQTTDGHFTDPVGHLQNALNPEFSKAAMGFQRVPDPNGQVAYNVIWEFMGVTAGDGVDLSVSPAITNDRPARTLVPNQLVVATGASVPGAAVLAPAKDQLAMAPSVVGGRRNQARSLSGGASVQLVRTGLTIDRPGLRTTTLRQRTKPNGVRLPQTGNRSAAILTMVGISLIGFAFPGALKRWNWS